jgi:hypothetical protein
MIKMVQAVKCYHKITLPRGIEKQTSIGERMDIMGL